MYEYSLDWQSTAAPDPREHPRAYGYLLGLTLEGTLRVDADLTVPAGFGEMRGNYPGLATAYDAANQRITCCGLIESLVWSGAAAGPIHLSCYLSEKNATQLNAHVLVSGRVDELRFWVAGYDSAGGTGSWYEAAYPLGSWPSGQEGSVRGTLARTGDRFALDLRTEGQAIRGTHAEMYYCSLAVVPPREGTYTLFAAESKTAKMVQPWGVKVGR